MVVLTKDNSLARVRSTGKIKKLTKKLTHNPLVGSIGIAHTRWATHGMPAENNAHPHICNNQVAIVHNGIIENHQQLKQQQLEQGFKFTSETDTEVIVHAIFNQLQACKDLFKAVQKTLTQLEGAYALAVIAPHNGEELIVARKGSPLVIGVGIGEHFIASDVSALLPVTQQFMFLEDGDIAKVTCDSVLILDKNGKEVMREVKTSSLSVNSVELGNYRHYMQKEIFEQPQSVTNTLAGRIIGGKVQVSSFGHDAEP
ncbi:MAG TPA: glutamine--fructose-6-phosphate aminotransferase, partial [Thiotrichaceae bacterium]|nr:glutamine--fructose-6-phosphate aminotransferase [Thiotrichaceae bacterium]